jgi:hypothetical protein
MVRPTVAEAQPAGPGQVSVKVHVTPASRALKLSPGLPVELLVMQSRRAGIDKSVRLRGLTDERGTATIFVPASESDEKPTVCLAAVDCLGTTFFSQPFRLMAGQAECEIEIRVVGPPAVLPRWSYVALAVIFLAALALVALRPADNQLRD